MTKRLNALTAKREMGFEQGLTLEPTFLSQLALLPLMSWGASPRLAIYVFVEV